METQISNIAGVVAFFLVLIVDYGLILWPKVHSKNKKNKKRKKDPVIMELQFLQKKFNLDLFKVDLDYVIKWFAFFNAFIIAVTSTVVMLIPWPMIFQFMLGFVILLGLTYSIYELFGRHLVKKGWTR